MSPRLQRLRAEIASDRHALTLRLDELVGLHLGAVSASPGDVARVAIDLHHAYSAVESIMLRLARAFEGEPVPGPDWHQALLHGMSLEIEGVRPRAFSEPSYAALRMLLAFRHFFRHAYAVALDPAQLEAVRVKLLDARSAILGDLDAVDAFLAGLANASP